MAKVAPSFVDSTLWPEFQALNEYVSNITEKVINDHIFKDSSETTVMDNPKQIE
jgi:hypothetical protein